MQQVFRSRGAGTESCCSRSVGKGLRVSIIYLILPSKLAGLWTKLLRGRVSFANTCRVQGHRRSCVSPAFLSLLMTAVIALLVCSESRLLKLPAVSWTSVPLVAWLLIETVVSSGSNCGWMNQVTRERKLNEK